MFMPQPKVTEAKQGLAGTVPEIALRAARKPHKDRVEQKPKKIVTTVSGNCRQVYQLAKSVGASDREAEILVYVAQHESTCNSSAKNPTSSATGLLQFTDNSWSFYCTGNRLDPKDQLRCGLAGIRRKEGCDLWWNWWNGKYDGRFGSCT